jgi:hypothetical protein
LIKEAMEKAEEKIAQQKLDEKTIADLSTLD